MLRKNTLLLVYMLALVLAACGGAGESAISASTPTPATTPTPINAADFDTRCKAPGVVKCIGFDAASDITGGFGSNSQRPT